MIFKKDGNYTLRTDLQLALQITSSDYDFFIRFHKALLYISTDTHAKQSESESPMLILVVTSAKAADSNGALFFNPSLFVKYDTAKIK